MTGFRTAVKKKIIPLRFQSGKFGLTEDGKIVRVHRMDASKRKRGHAQASKQQAKWKNKSK